MTMFRDEKDLVREAARGDRSAMADLYGRNIGYLVAVCSRYISSEEDRNDVLQSSFVKIFSSIGRFECERGYQIPQGTDKKQPCR